MKLLRFEAILENGDYEETDRDVEIEVGRLRKISNLLMKKISKFLQELSEYLETK